VSRQPWQAMKYSAGREGAIVVPAKAGIRKQRIGPTTTMFVDQENSAGNHTVTPSRSRGRALTPRDGTHARLAHPAQ
jgi:hypothetical protein